MLMQPLYLGSNADVAGWDAWAYGTSLATIVLAGVATPSTRSAVAVAAWMTCAQLLGNLPVSLPAKTAATTWSNAGTLLINTMVVHFVWAYLKRLGAQADQATREAEEHGVTSERERLKPMLHENAGLLSLWLKTSEAPQGVPVRSVRAMVGRLRAAIEDRQDAAAATDLCGVVGEVCADFVDLGIEVNTLLIRDMLVPVDQLAAVRDTLATILSNVRLHAEATHVVLLADCWPLDGGMRWSIDVHDNGIGFDPQMTATRFGLGDQIRAFEQVGGQVLVTSTLGEGTTVQLSAAVGGPTSSSQVRHE